MSVSNFVKAGVIAASALLGTLSMSTAASANCGGGNYCHAGSAGNSLQPISMYKFNSGQTVQSRSSAMASASAYASASSGQVMASSRATSTYGSGSISSAYASASSSVSAGSSAFSTGNVTSLRVPGLGAGERLCATSCPVNVYNPQGGKVLGCYNICKPATPLVKRKVRYVRPVYYVRYAVPVPTCQRCTPQFATRYGLYNN